MNLIKKIYIFCNVIFLFGCNIKSVVPNDAITITSPANGSTVIGNPLSISGTSSLSNFKVRIIINSTIIGTTITDGSGNWNFSLQNVNNADYIISANLISDAFEILATDTKSFSVHNAETIRITKPIENETIVFVNSLVVEGISSLSTATVNIYIDNNFVTTTTTDYLGNWQTLCAPAVNGNHTIMADLLYSGSVVASSSINVFTLTPVIFPSGKTQIRVIEGDLLTFGSGSGPGYTYSVSGSIATISFIPIFSSVPSVVAIGQRSSGSSTVTLSSVNSTAASISFSTGTQKIHFSATAFA